MFIIFEVHYLISVYQNILKVGLGLSHETHERVRRVFTDLQPVGIQQSLVCLVCTPSLLTCKTDYKKLK